MTTNNGRKAYRAKWYQENKERVKEVHRRYHYRTKFKLTVEEYETKLAQQNYVCAICKKPEIVYEWRTGNVRKLSIDHCHHTGKIRGLLCTKCNHALGFFNDDPAIFQEAIDYLNKYKGTN